MHPCRSIYTEHGNSTDSKMRTVILWFFKWLILWDFDISKMAITTVTSYKAVLHIYWYRPWSCMCNHRVSWQQMKIRAVIRAQCHAFNPAWHQSVSPATRKASTLRWDPLCLCAKPCCCWQQDISLPPSTHCVDKKTNSWQTCSREQTKPHSFLMSKQTSLPVIFRW